MTRYATIGTISHATLRNEDLLESFADELERLGKASDFPFHPAAKNAICDARAVTDYDSENASETVNELADYLESYAPAYCYFGAHEGDGADFGFWPVSNLMESINDDIADGELVKIKDPGERVDGKNCVFINDHGNMTIYDWNGAIMLELV